ncbi:MAG: OPT/YSL family transporter [Spirochaetota bacterium]
MDTITHAPKGIMEHLTVRGLLIGLAGSLIITSSSMYVALRMGALPWPTIFAAVLSMALLKRWNNSTLQEINVTHTAMSSGAMVAGGLAFTLPGLWILHPEASVPTVQLIAVTVSGAVLGALFTQFHRKTYVERDPLPYPMGTAAYNTLIIGDTGGRQATLLFSSMGASAVFTALRDGLHAIPVALSTKMPGKSLPDLTVWLSPMAAGIGFIIGPIFTGVWVLGALVGYYLLIPLGTAWGWFADPAVADIFRQHLGIGLMVGTGAGILLKGFYLAVKRIKKVSFDTSQLALPAAVTAVVVLVLFILTDITLLQLVLAIVGIWMTTAMAALLTGQTGINPMEIFGIIVLLGISLFQRPGPVPAFMLAGLTAVACGLTGDVMNDFKAGKQLGTNPKAQLTAEALGAILGAVVSVIVLLAMHQAFGGFGTAELPAPQAAAVSQMVAGIADVPAFIIGLSVGTVLYLGKLPASTLGLGFYLPLNISAIVFVGGLARFITDRSARSAESRERITGNGSIVASGFLGGEGITGVLLAIFSIF